MKRRLLITALLFVGLFSAAQIALAGTLVVGTTSSQGKGFVTVPLSITGNSHAIGSVSVTIAYNGRLVSLSSKDISLAADTAAAGWQIHAASLPPSQTNTKGVQLHLYKAEASVVSENTISLADIQFNVLNATSNIPLTVSSFMVRDEAGVEITGYTAKSGSILLLQP